LKEADNLRHVKCCIEKKELLQKNVSDTCHLLTGWHKNYSCQSVCTESNDVLVFTTVSDDKEESNKGGKKKEIVCFKCKKTGHYSNECKEDPKDKHERFKNANYG